MSSRVFVLFLLAAGAGRWGRKRGLFDSFSVCSFTLRRRTHPDLDTCQTGSLPPRDSVRERGLEEEVLAAREDGQVGEAWGHTPRCILVTRVSPSLLMAACLQTPLSCLAEPTVWPSACCYTSSKLRRRAGMGPGKLSELLLSHSWAPCHLDPELIFQAHIVVKLYLVPF